MVFKITLIVLNFITARDPRTKTDWSRTEKFRDIGGPKPIVPGPKNFEILTVVHGSLITASNKQRYFPFYEKNEENPTFEALTELRSCARNLGVNILKLRKRMKPSKGMLNFKCRLLWACTDQFNLTQTLISP